VILETAIQCALVLWMTTLFIFCIGIWVVPSWVDALLSKSRRMPLILASPGFIIAVLVLIHLLTR